MSEAAHNSAPSTRWWDDLTGPEGALATLRRLPGLWLIPAIGFIASAFGVAATSGPILCLFRAVSGIPCAGCGMTRAFVAIGHGYPGAAFDYNPLSPVTWLWMLLWWLLAIAYLLRGKPMPPHPDWLLKTALVVLVSWWTVRVVAFMVAPDAWIRMVDTSPAMRLVDAFL